MLPVHEFIEIKNATNRMPVELDFIICEGVRYEGGSFRTGWHPMSRPAQSGMFWAKVSQRIQNAPKGTVKLGACDPLTVWEAPLVPSVGMLLLILCWSCFGDRWLPYSPKFDERC